MPVSPARSAAFDILLRVARENSYASELLHSAAYAQLSAKDHPLATELVFGVLRWRSRLDDEIVAASSQPLTKLDPEVLASLRLALYQFRWLDRIPQRAALHESVELVKRARKRSAAPFVNAVLRKLADAESSMPQEASSADALARLWAHPFWLVERWVAEYGFSVARTICEHDQLVPAAVLRLRHPEAEAELIREGVVLAPGALLASARRVVSGDVTKTRAFRAGQVVIQDEASQLVAALVTASQNNQNGQSMILDCCAAPGGKTLAMADRNPEALINAVELHPHRARLLQSRVKTAFPSARIQIIAGDARYLPTSRLFARVLADVPCSGTGTLARNPEIKWRLSAADLAELHARQAAILSSAMNQVQPGGRIVYATCSLETEENETVIEEALSRKAFRLIDCGAELARLRAAGELNWCSASFPLTRGPYLRTLPGIHPCEGFFAAILERNEARA